MLQDGLVHEVARCGPVSYTHLDVYKRQTIVRTENGYNVTCHISGGEMELMSLTVYVPDLYQAREVKKKMCIRDRP